MLLADMAAPGNICKRRYIKEEQSPEATAVSHLVCCTALNSYFDDE